MNRNGGIAFASGLLLLTQLAGRDVVAAEPVTIRAITEPIEVDGRLDETAWSASPSLSEFFENEPGDAEAAPVRAEVWLGYDEENLYIAVRAHDWDPQRIVASYRRRDRVTDTDDFVSVYLDTIGDRLSAFEFRVNPRGSRLDAIWDETTFSSDYAPDFFFEVEATITSGGWSAEYRIPLSSLRYDAESKQPWGVLVRRNWPRRYRYILDSSPILRGSNCLLCHMQPIAKIDDLASSWHLVVAPYGKVSGGGTSDTSITTSSSTPNLPGGGGPNIPQNPGAPSGPQNPGVPTGPRNPGTPAPNGPGGPASEIIEVSSRDFAYDDFDMEGGGDIKWSPHPQHVVDLTIYPDFSEIESDVAQLEANQRFALFFPEQRPFFLEGITLFATPMDAVDTRTIGSPRVGARSTGRIANTSYTVLTVQNRGGGSTIIPGSEFSTLAEQDFQSVDSIARIRHARDGSHVGLLFTDREIFDGASGHNRVIGPDFLWRPNQTDRVEGQFLWSDSLTPDESHSTPSWDGSRLSGHALDLRWQHQTRSIDWSTRYRDIGSGFRADLGFVPQVGIRQGQGSLGYTVYWDRDDRPSGFFRQARPAINGSVTADQDGSIVSWFATPGVRVSGAWNSLGIIEVNTGAIRVNGDLLERTNVFFLTQIDPSFRWISRINLNGNAGQEIDFDNGRVGNGVRLSGGAVFEPTDRWSLEVLGNLQLLDVKVNGRSQRLFTEWTARLQTNYSFTSRLFLRLIGEWVETKRDPSLYFADVDERSGGLQASVLLTYEINWQTRIDIGYEESDLLDSSGSLEPNRRRAFLKVSYAFQL